MSSLRGFTATGLVALGACVVAACGSDKAGGGDAPKAWGNLFGCMVGPPLEDDENLEARFRSIDAALGSDKKGWPGTCDKPLQDFYKSLGSDDKSEGIRQLMNLELKCETKCSIESLRGKLGQLLDSTKAANILPVGAAEVKDAPPRLSGKALPESAFTPLVAGTFTVQGMTSIGEQKTAFLLRDTGGALQLCEVDPDASDTAKCGKVTTSLRASSARLVEGKSKSLLYGVTKMGTTPEETEYGVFDAWTGAATEDDPKTVTAATDRPRLPPTTKAWFEGQLDGVKVKLERADNGVLRLDRGDEAPRIVMDDADHGGPGTAEPIPLIGKKRVVILFRTKKGLAGLTVPGKGEVTATK